MWQREVYGHSVLGSPLEIYLPENPVQTLIVGALHGDEPETTWMLARLLENVSPKDSHAAIILTMNPDGLQRGVRSNAVGVDLNRNFPASRWRSGSTNMYPAGTPLVPEMREDRDMTVHWSSGLAPASEPETKALISVCEKLKYPFLVNVHTPLHKLAWSGPMIGQLGTRLEQISQLPLVVQETGVTDPDLYGCIREWYTDLGKSCLTYEFPYAALTHLLQTQLDPLKFLTQSHDRWN